MSEYIKKEDALHQFDSGFYSRDYVHKTINDLPTYSFPESKEMKQLYSDLLRVKHDTMNIDSLIDKVYADMRGKDNDTV